MTTTFFEFTPERDGLYLMKMNFDHVAYSDSGFGTFDKATNTVNGFFGTRRFTTKIGTFCISDSSARRDKRITSFTNFRSRMFTRAKLKYLLRNMNLPSSGGEKYPHSRRDGKILIDLKRGLKDSFFMLKESSALNLFLLPEHADDG